MGELFDSNVIAERGWRQGAILGVGLAERARRHAPETVLVTDADWLIVTSHDCDIINNNIDKEPVVEVLLGTTAT
jgi:hypothetical protein